jgi:ribonuclease Z
MLEVHFLGTGAMMPLPERRLASILVRRNGQILLIDCGEGTQVAIRESGWSMAKIDFIAFTHFHADHIAGLPGLLLTMGTMGRTAPVRLIGPTGLKEVVQRLRVIAPELAFELQFTEISEGFSTAFGDARLTAFPLEHVLPCFGYAVELPRPGRFDRSRAEENQIPIKYWRALQSGERVEADGHVYTPEMALGPERVGLKLVYCTDTRPVNTIVARTAGADLLICEGTYAQREKAEKAAQYGHMTFPDAAELAARAGAKALLLTHFSPTVPDPEDFLDIPRGIFPNTDAARDGLTLMLRFWE